MPVLQVGCQACSLVATALQEAKVQAATKDLMLATALVMDPLVAMGHNNRIEESPVQWQVAVMDPVMDPALVTDLLVVMGHNKHNLGQGLLTIVLR
jgi:hypothetical protein